MVEELVVHDVASPAWLPAGSAAQVITRSTPPHPMCLVRLLMRCGDHVFCVPRDGNGKLDLPTRRAQEGDEDGTATIVELSELFALSKRSPVFIGAVRNIVSSPSETYPWPTPHAYFGVWTIQAEPILSGSWVKIGTPDSPLVDRHWHPLLEAGRDASAA